MNKRDFTKTLNSVTVKGKLDIGKVNSLPVETKRELALFIIRAGGQVLAELVDGVLTEKPFDVNWLYSMGYLHKTTGKNSHLTFYHKAEHRIN